MNTGAEQGHGGLMLAGEKTSKIKTKQKQKYIIKMN
jgi:hypothetical protein